MEEMTYGQSRQMRGLPGVSVLLADLGDPIGAALRSQSAPLDLTGPVVLYGAGQLGRWTLKAMRTSGMEDSIVCFVDSDPKKWAADIDGIPVRAPSMSPRAALHVVTVYNGSAVRKQLEAEGLRVASFAAFYRAALLGKPGVAVPYGSLDDAAEIRRHEHYIRQGYDVWADDASRAEYVAQIRYRVSLEEPTTPALPPSDIYFPPEQPFAKREVYVDCGAFDGDSVTAFLERCYLHDRIIAIEPDPANTEKLVRSLQGQDYRIIHAAVSNRAGVVRFNATGTAGSKIDPDGTMAVQTVRLDDILADEVPTRIKMDIEGAEPMALIGGCRTIRKHLPHLAICLYHSPEHLWTIPIYLRGLGYSKLLLRRYGEDCWETVCYAVKEGA